MNAVHEGSVTVTVTVTVTVSLSASERRMNGRRLDRHRSVA